MLLEAVAQELELTPEETNPFQESTRLKPCELAEAYSRATAFWREKVCGQSRETLEEFVRQFVRGEAGSIEDLVRLVNAEARTLYKKRDLVLLVRRMQPLTPTHLLALLGQPQN